MLPQLTVVQLSCLLFPLISEVQIHLLVFSNSWVSEGKQLKPASV